MKRPLALLLLAALPCLAAKPPSVPADQWLAEVIESPGSYSQMCMMGGLSNPSRDLPVYQYLLPRQFHLSDDVLEPLKKRRAEVVPALGRLIAAIKPEVPVQQVEPPPWAARKPVKLSDLKSHSGVSPKQVSGLLLELVEGLNAIETLPELLELEQRLDQALARAEKDASVPVPTVDFDAAVYLTKKPQPPPRELELMKGRAVQREMLGIMLKLLRNQRYQPLLDSEFEQAYARALKKRAAEKDLRGIKTDEDARKRGLIVDGNWMGFDPVYHIPVGRIYPTPTVPYTPKAREKARGLVASFLATVPRKSWKTSVP